jgi:hypothetical protein
MAIVGQKPTLTAIIKDIIITVRLGFLAKRICHS